MDHYPSNTVLQWKTKLSEFVELEDKWEVGLLKVSFPGKVYDIFGDRFHFTTRSGLIKDECMLKNGAYYSILRIVIAMQWVYREVQMSDTLVEFCYDTIARHITIIFTENFPQGTNVSFSKDTASMAWLQCKFSIMETPQ